MVFYWDYNGNIINNFYRYLVKMEGRRTKWLTQ